MGLTDTKTGVHDGGLLDDETVGEQLADILAGVCIADFSGLVRIEPDLAFAAAEHLGGKRLLRAKIGHGVSRRGDDTVKEDDSRQSQSRP